MPNDIQDPIYGGGSPAPTSTPTRPVGWYPVQGLPEMRRYWDGAKWGEVRNKAYVVDAPARQPKLQPLGSRVLFD
jgi:hypothetical protein